MATTAVAPGTMKAAQIYKPEASVQLVELAIPAPGQGHMRSSLVTKEERSLLACARAGDAAAFANLVMPHRDGILGLTQRILRNREDAEDAVQTAFLDALRHLDTFQGRSRFSSWLTRIALNAAFMRLRLSRRRPETSLDDMVERDTSAKFQVVEARLNPEQECSVKEARALLAKAFHRLGPLYGEVLHMFHVQELSAKEAARILGVPVGTVKARLHRARSRLSRHLQPLLVRRRGPVITHNGFTPLGSKRAFGA
jgi:RNA polymerase sigma-70 factor (ECF subfamily)